MDVTLDWKTKRCYISLEKQMTKHWTGNRMMLHLTEKLKDIILLWKTEWRYTGLDISNSFASQHLKQLLSHKSN